MTEKRFKEEFLEEMNEIKKEKPERVTVDDIIGLIKTDEPTNSVEEVRKLRGRETEKRFTIKPQDDYFGVTDNYSADKVNVVNGIRTEIEAEWLCELLNELHEENQELRLLVDTLKEQNMKFKLRLKDLGVEYL